MKLKSYWALYDPNTGDVQEFILVKTAKAEVYQKAARDGLKAIAFTQLSDKARVQLLIRTTLTPKQEGDSNG